MGGHDKKLTHNEYLAQFDGDEKRIRALDRGWKNRDFEIELYWKRANYFWAFIASAFAGYFLIVSRPNADFRQAELLLGCIGFIFSLGWFLVNKGSKKWQENWEKHIDMLETPVTGPIYQIVLDKKGYSVSGINKKISEFVVFVWLLLIISYLTKPESFGEALWFEVGTLVVTLYFTRSLFKKRRGVNPKPEKDNDGWPLISFSLRRAKYRKSDQGDDKKNSETKNF